ncbi:hypothetical protein Esti_002004 [Eimeria stiedai]
MARKLFIVTGANKGIGFEVVKKLCKELKNDDAVVLMTSRCLERGKEALSKLEAEGFKPSLEQLDLTDNNSIKRFADTVKDKYGEIDSLVNNAGFAFPHNASESLATQAKETCAINYFGTRSLCKELCPLLKKGARVVNVASVSGQKALEEMSETNRQRLMSKNATLQDIDTVVEAFVQACEEGKTEGWPKTTYGLSKAALIAVTAAWARMYKRNPEKEVIVTSCCPGWCKTDMGGWEQPPLSASDGADVIVPLALRASKEQHGKFVTQEGTFDLSEDVDGTGDGCGYVRMPEIHEMKSK